MPGDPWHGLWLCRDEGVIPVGFARAVHPWQARLSVQNLLSGAPWRGLLGLHIAQGFCTALTSFSLG